MGAKVPGLYLITDRRLAAGGLINAAVQALEAGVRLIQLREKDLGGRELLELARALRARTTEAGARLIINDRVDVALLSGADGVHLAASSIPPGDARLLLGNSALIGVSAHSAEEAQKAEAGGADYITLGPVYFTPSKAKWGGPLGTDVIKEAKRRVKIPVYAIGGINRERVGEVIRAGADGVAVISAVLGVPDVFNGAAGVLRELESGKA